MPIKQARIKAKNNPFYSLTVGGVKFTVGAESANVITVSVQFLDANNNNLAQRVWAPFYLSDNSDGSTITATAPNSGIAAGASGGLVIENIADKAGVLVSTTAGLSKVAFSESGTPTWYLVVCLPDGTIAVSPAITFA
jgi:hypothetical protein